MKNNKMKILSAVAVFALCAVLLATGAQAKVYTTDEIAEIARGILACELSKSGASSVQVWLDGENAEGASMPSEWLVIGLRQSGEKFDFSAYADALEAQYLMRSARNATGSQKYALTMIAAGRKDDEAVARIADETVGAQGIMSYIFGLHLITNGAPSENHTADSVISEILSLRRDDGGWSLTGARSDVDVTSMAVQALAPYYDGSDEVKAAVDEAVGLLASRQLEGGDFASYGNENAESVAQVIVALSALGIDIQQDSRFIKNGNTAIDGLLKYRLPDGGFSHMQGREYNSSATAQAYYALVAYLRCRDGRSPLFVFDDAEIIEPPEIESEQKSQAKSAESEPVAESAGDAGQTEGDGKQAEIPKSSYKLWVILGIAAAAALVCALFWLTGQRNIKNFIFIILLAAIAAAAVALVDIKTASEYYTGTLEPKENVAGRVTMTIRCDVLVGVAKDEHIPSDGVILAVTEFEISEGDTVYDVLMEAARAYRIHTETEGTNYISGIANIYELDYGDLSGWAYLVNGERPSVGCGEYKLRDGDTVEWHYTLELGDDIR